MRDAPDKRRSAKPASDGAPLTDQALLELGSVAFHDLGSVILAVSGGPDSMLLMHMAARWRASSRARPIAMHVATVDHGLRPEAAAEARWVAQQSAHAGFPHHVLQWSGPKPAAGIQEAARMARYSLLAGLAGRLGLPRPSGLLLGHHLDDQAETFVMRLARGSGVDGLSAMQVRLAMPGADGMLLVRPFLGVSKATLLATLSRIGVDWLHDPSNDHTGYERVRVRKALAALADAGVDAEAVTTSARRLARARAALEHATDGLADAALSINDGAFAEVRLAPFDAAPAELRLRLLQRIVAGFGDGRAPPRLARLEDLEQRLAAGQPLTATLAGCRLERARDSLIAVREPGRRGLPELTLQPGASQVWDHRFVVSAPTTLSRPLTVKALPAATWKDLQSRGPAIALSRQAALTLPSFWDGPRLLAIPHPAIAFGSGQGLQARPVAAIDRHASATEPRADLPPGSER